MKASLIISSVPYFGQTQTTQSLDIFWSTDFKPERKHCTSLYQYLDVKRKILKRKKELQLISLLLLHMVELYARWSEFFLKFLQLKSLTGGQLPQLPLFLNWILKWNTKWHCLTILPYRTLQQRSIALLAYTFLNISVKIISKVIENKSSNSKVHKTKT